MFQGQFEDQFQVKNSFFPIIIFFKKAVKEIHLVEKEICCQKLCP
jgi:hypothetical protein